MSLLLALLAMLVKFSEKRRKYIRVGFATASMQQRFPENLTKIAYFSDGVGSCSYS